jgi:hypothetical protein
LVSADAGNNRVAVVKDGARELSGRADDGDDLSRGRQCNSREMKSEYEQ